MTCYSLDEFVDLALQLVQSGLKTHVHELRLSVHLQASLDARIDCELQLELFASIFWVGFQSSQHLTLLIRVQSLCRNDRDFLLLVKKSIEFRISISNMANEGEPFVLCKNLQELHSQRMESSNTLQSLVELNDLLCADTCILREQVESLGVIVQTFEVDEVFVDGIECFLLGGRRKKNAGISSLDSVLSDWWLVVWCSVHYVGCADTEW